MNSGGWEIRIQPKAEHDIEEVLLYTVLTFGEAQYQTYLRLIGAALDEIAANPYTIRSRQRDELQSGARTLHLQRHGQNASHFFLYRVVDPPAIEIIRLLHDGMDVGRHIPVHGE